MGNALFRLVQEQRKALNRVQRAASDMEGKLNLIFAVILNVASENVCPENVL